ncbi:TPA: hypothetical protein ACMY33_001810 [Yersinia enterocolitica]|uniref:hypothetical protein n=1 Tax=Yersinia enterocolitica TaxID=630 RepID=UPI0013DDD168|nr:hypothetical protein [Yersinia enterocolitica]MDA5484028.1 hypothetical protein [Yersinia enterocolitica]NGN36012.1 hypothetical protein [Yersinia enterocolitica subsp. palearctica]HDL7393721.1 hypothetical protein [Yersinia enterocolitica]HDL7444948.1 hypothetical protein [Yersinia enterocolitica]HDL8567467.1 hypothetical protein [Yersinia enterocolitica]
MPARVILLALSLLTNLLCRIEAGGLTAPMGAPAAHAATTHSAHFPALLLCQRSECQQGLSCWH